MLIWNYFNFSDWPLEKLESVSGEKAKGSHPLTQRSYLAGRIALKLLLKNQNLPLEILPNEEFGFLALRSGFGSIAHSEEVTVAALSSDPVGIDIENRSREVSHILSKVASSQEIEKLNLIEREMKIQVKDQGLFLWTAKEAFSKALGLGLRNGVHNLQINLEGTLPFEAKSVLETPMTLKNPVVTFQIVEQFLVSFCFERNLSAMPLRLNLSELQNSEIPIS